jgi:hypothetical protein
METSTVDLAGAYFKDRAGRYHDAGGSRRYISAAASVGRVHVLSPEEAKAAGVEYGTRWSAELVARGVERTATAATADVDDDDLPPAPQPTEAPGPVEAAPPPRPAPAAEPTPPPAAPVAPSSSDAPPPAAAVHTEPIEATPPPPPPPEEPPPPTVDIATLAPLLAGAAVEAWGTLLVRLGTPKGCKPNPLTEKERAGLQQAFGAVVARYLPTMETNHQEAFAFVGASVGVILAHRFAPHEPAEPPAPQLPKDGTPPKPPPAKEPDPTPPKVPPAPTNGGAPKGFRTAPDAGGW